MRIPIKVKELASNADAANFDFSFTYRHWRPVSSLRPAKTLDLVNQLVKHNDLLYLRKKTIEKVILYTIENVRGKLLVTDRSYKD